jgi:hypothetical protein
MKKFLLLLLCGVNLFASAQSGITWNMGMNIASTTTGNDHPRVVINAAGNPLVLWGHSNDAMFSRWNGTMFTTPVMLNPMTMMIAHASWMGPDIASHGDTIYVVFKQMPEGDTASHIWLVRSFDGGVNFSTPVQVDSPIDTVTRFPAVTTDSLGNPVVAYMNFNASFGNAQWAVATSNDFGSTFSPSVQASGWSSGTSTVCDCCPGAVVSSGNNVSVLYRDNNNNIRDSWAGLSTNGGNSFSGGWNIDQNNWMIMSCPATGPDGVIIGDSLFSVFMNGNGGSRVYRSVSSLTGMAVQSSQLVTGSITGLTYQNYPRIDRYGNAIGYVWKQIISGVEQLALSFTNDINNGFPAASDTVDLNDITNTDVAISNGNVFVVWEDDNSGTVKYRKGTFNMPTAIEEGIEQVLFSVSPNPVANGVINILRNNAKNTQIIYTITNLLGQELIYNSTTFQNNSLLIDVSNLVAGTYFLKIESDNKLLVSKIIKP